MLSFEFSLKYITRFLLLLPAICFSNTPAGITYEHHDWQLVCDNTRTCRAAGYQSDDSIDSPIALVFERKAGPNEPISAELYLGSWEGDIEFPDKPTASLHINNRFQGNLSVDMGSAKLTSNQIGELLNSVKRPSKIEVTSGRFKWTLSDKGSSAVLMKMDEYQRRIGTANAIFKKGPKDDGGVLPPLKPSVIIAASTPGQMPADEQFAKNHYNDLYPALRDSLEEDSVCNDYLRDMKDEKPELAAIRLSENKILIYTLCWRGAYNVGLGYWVVNSSPPFEATLVTDSGSDYADGVIWASHKRRGLGDCGYTDEWTWDGREFIHTEQNQAGLCKGIPGGISLPRIVTKVQKLP